MILLVAVILGIIAGLASAWVRGRSYDLGDFHRLWIVLVAFIPQYLAFYQPMIRIQVSREWAAVALVGSQLLLLAFVWLNRTSVPILCMGLGLLLNLAVILANGGLMPISPQTLARLAPDGEVASWTIGERVFSSKNIVLPEESTRLSWLTDRWTLPEWVRYRVAFSAGDVVLAVGVFWLLWRGGAAHHLSSESGQTTSSGIRESI